MHVVRAVITVILIFFNTVASFAQSVVTKAADPGSRNVRVIYYDNSFLFMARNYGDVRDYHGNTEPGLFVHSSVHGRWLQIIQISTSGARLGKTESANPEDYRRLLECPVGWDFTRYANIPMIDIPLKTSGSIAFPERIELDKSGDRYKMDFFTSLKVENAATVLYVKRKDLWEQFNRTK